MLIHKQRDILKKVESVKAFKTFCDCHIKHADSQTKGYFEKPLYDFWEECVGLLALKWNF